MHRLIRILVLADTSDEALAEARRIVEEKVSGFPSGAPFDGATWGKALQVSTTRFPCEDSAGMQEAMNALHYTRHAFADDIKHIRELIASSSDEELFASNDFQTSCIYAAGVEDDGAYLFDFHGCPVSRLYELQKIVTDTDADHNHEGMDNSREYLATINKKLWIVPANVHM